MNTIEINADWTIAMDRLKQKWGQLTDDDLHYVEGRGADLFVRIQKRTGGTREVIEKATQEAFSRFWAPAVACT